MIPGEGQPSLRFPVLTWAYWLKSGQRAKKTAEPQSRKRPGPE